MNAQGLVEQYVQAHTARLGPGTRLPVDRRIARACGVSVMTVRRCLTRMAVDGRVTRIAGSGTFVPWPSGRITPPAGPTLAYHQVAQRVSEAIRTGEYPLGEPLPMNKELAQRNHCSTATVSKALGLLLDSGMVHKRGRRCYPGRSAPRVSRATGLVYLAYVDLERFTLFRGNKSVARVFESFESELNRANVRLVPIPMRELWDRLRDSSGPVPLGTVLLGDAKGAFTRRDLAGILPWLERIIHRSHLHHMRVLCLTVNHLIRHRRVSYATFSHAMTAQARLLASRCLAWPYRSVVLLGSAYPSDRDWHLDIVTSLRTLTELDHACQGVTVRIGERDQRLSGIAAATPRSLKPLLLHPMSHYLIRLSKYRPYSSDELFDTVFFFGSFDDLDTMLSPRTLIVARRAALARELHEHLVRTGHALPEDCGLIALEESPELAVHGISSVTMDHERNGYLLAHVLLDDVKVTRSKRGFIDMTARVILRESTPFMWDDGLGH